ncbi:ferredoxin [Subtercola boreus]|uniref:Ferredoxin n=1 Tax=Subtercola boreus TaxID=120213 RepID=A0A3E0VKG7_9MICO|nr:ferredoxin [Subtercola boreus]RFA10376.1 ferredoxin [Subtercola boreus]TQL56108.1 ferredoxin [Subtercola boreus]
MKIIVDRDRCTGLGNCEALAAEYFEVDEDGSLTVLREDIDAADLGLVERAVAGCPMAALRIEA